ncbi:MAG: CBS domain-containing protein [Nitrospira sp.]|nr:CBS domain-containing protein [Nitrospira sp.]
MTLTVVGVKIRLGLSWIFLAPFLVWSLAEGYFRTSYLGLTARTYWWMAIGGTVGLLGSLFFHEWSHACMAKRRGVSVPASTLFLFGGVPDTTPTPSDPKTESWIALVGPLASMALGIVWYLAFEIGYRANLPLAVLGIFNFLAFANGLVGGVNLLPAFPLDGGVLLRAWLRTRQQDIQQATRLASVVGSLCGFLLMMTGFLHIVNGRILIGIWWFLIGLFLRETAGTAYYHLVTQVMLASMAIRRVMTPNPITVSSDTSILRFVEDYFHRSFHHLYPVMEDSRLIGCVGPKQIAAIPREQWTELTTRDLAIPCSQDNTIDINSDTEAALSLMNKTGNSSLLVVDKGQLAGIVTLKDLLKFLTLKLHVKPSL